MFQFNLYIMFLIIICIIILVKKFNIMELFTQKTKCFSCEKESKKPHPSNCYSCEEKKNNILLNKFPQRWG